MANQLNTRIVIRNDSTSNWLTNSNQVLLKGEIGIEFGANDKVLMKVGDGVKTWAELNYVSGGSESQFFEGTKQDNETDMEVISRVVGTTELSEGAIFVVKSTISGAITQYTSYVYSNSAWKATDGNYNAENVYFDEDLITTSAVGVISLTNGQATIPSTGKNLKEVFNTIFVQEKNPTITQPSAGINLSGAGNHEAGTTLNPSYSTSFNPGSYQYGPATGVTVTSWSISDGTNSYTTSTGSLNSITATDGISYRVTATASHTAGAIPLTNTGNAYPAGQITAKSTAVAGSSYITSHRKTFYGVTTDKATPTDSNVIRTLSGKSSSALSNGNTFNVSIPVGALRVIIAYPATLREVNSIKDVNGLNAEIKSGFTASTVQVEGVNGYNPIAYKVYTMDFANPNDKANTFSVQI